MGTKDYTLGKGALFFRLSSDPENVWRDLGNIPDFKITMESEVLEHYSSRSGLKTLDWQTLISSKATWSASLEEMTKDNAQLFLLAPAPTVISQTGGTVSVAETFTAYKGRAVEVAEPLEIYDVVVKDDATPTPTTFVENTDYQVFNAEGLIKVLEDGSIPDGSILKITYKYRNISQVAGSVASEAHADVDQSDVVSLSYKYVSNVVVKDDGTPTPETFAVDDDYTVDAVTGEITIVVGGGIADGTNLVIAYDYAKWDEHHLIEVAANTELHEGHIKFIGDPPAGRKITIKGYATVQSEGDMALISDEILKLGIKGEFLSGHGYNKLLNFVDRGRVTI